MTENLKGALSKKRDDIIDTLQLRQKEKRVFYYLLVLLAIAVSYEFGAELTSSLFYEEQVQPQLGVRKYRTINKQPLLKLIKTVKATAEDVPQFSPFFSKKVKEIEEIVLFIAEKPDDKTSLEKKEKALLIGLLKFLKHPIAAEKKELTKLKTAVQRLLRVLKVNPSIDFEIAELKFQKDFIVAKEAIATRNIFEFESESDTSEKDKPLEEGMQLEAQN
jgi:hypothetical protein